MPIDNPPHILGPSLPLCADDETLKSSASVNSTLISKPSLDMGSLQRPHEVSACPRCHSLDTKFCYFNNYNVKQPRHFCRKCQRYWTAGGALRNVPVGAGRRKHKNPLNSTVPSLHPEENDLVLPHFSPASAMSNLEHDRHSGLSACKGTREAMVHNPAPASSFSHDAQSDIQQKEEASSSLHHQGAFHYVKKDAEHVQHTDKDVVSPPSSSPLSSHGSIEEKMEVESSASTQHHALDKKIDMSHPLGWLEQVSKANASVASECIALQGAYGYGNASLAWSQPLMWPWLFPYVTKNGPTCSNMEQAAVSAAWASAVTATAANILKISPLWNPYGWGSRDVNKTGGLSVLGKRGCSSLHEQEPLCIPKTLKIGHPEEAMHSSILMTLGISSLSTSPPASVAGFFNTDFRSKGDVSQCKPTVQLLQHRSHANPVAQARSLAFQESS